jgi:hypothetical protein
MSDFHRPTGRGGWLVHRNDLADREADTRRLAMRARYRAMSDERVVRKSLVDPRLNVTLPALRFLETERQK